MKGFDRIQKRLKLRLFIMLHYNRVSILFHHVGVDLRQKTSKRKQTASIKNYLKKIVHLWHVVN